MPSTQGLSGRVGLSTCPAVLLMLISGTSAAAAEGDMPGCTPVIGRVVSRQGSVEIRRASAPEWHRVERLDTNVCDGDAVRTGPRSRAALWLQPENLIRLDQKTAVTLSSNQAETRVEFFSSGKVSADPDCGAAYFISRFPRNFGVRTPFLSAAIKGTEFLVAAQCSSTTLAVFEGIVAAQELQTGREFKIETLQQISVGPGLPSSIPIPIKPRDGVQWTIYYPRTASRRTRGQETFLEQCPTGPLAAECEIGNVEALLAVGAVEEAEGTIKRLRADGTGGASLSALEAVIRIALNDRDGAMRLAESAIQAEPENPRAWLAMSYARQARLDLDGAFEAAKRAAILDSTTALPKVREAELLLTLGRIREARASSVEAVRLDPSDPLSLQTEGFVALAQVDAHAAKRAFQAAIDLDSSNPRARLGLGLALIRLGNLTEGRENLEIALALDPTDAVTRTYLGRAYFEENKPERDLLAGTQYQTAAGLDEADPTPWFYEGARKQSMNRPLEALEDFRQSSRRNDNRAVYRPRDALDQDAASRSVAQARVYSGLGFEEPAVSELATALSEDPSNYAAHQYLSEASAGLSRQQLTRASAGLQAQLRQPLGMDTPLVGIASVASLQPQQPYLSPDTIGPARPGFYDFDPVFSGTGFRARARGLVGELGTAADELSASAVFGRSSIAIGQVHAETNGQRVNNDQLRNAYAALANLQLTPVTRLQFEVQHSDTTFGDIPIRFDPTFVYADQRSLERFTVGRVGLRQAISAQSEVIGAVTHSEVEYQVSMATGPFISTTNGSFTSTELQYAGASKNLQFVAGASFIEGTRRELQELPAFGLSFGSTFGDRSTTAYVYPTFSLAGGAVRATVGAAWDDSNLQSIALMVERWHPKLGVIWNIDDATTVRFAQFRATQRQLIAGQTIEPVQVAGFGQMFDDPYGSIARRTALAVDRRVGSTLIVGAGGGLRRIEVPSTYIDANGITQSTINPWAEREGYAYVRWMARSSVAASLQVTREAFERTPENPGLAQFVSLTQWRVPLAIQWFNPNGLAANLRVSYMNQEGTFCTGFACDLDGQQKSVITDFGVSYRFPRRFGQISLDVLNLFDRQFLYQSLDTSRFVPFTGRAVFGRVFLHF